MRRGRRGAHGVLEFGGSGEDSFVAVVVTKLTGALLFILLLSMVIMALIPKAVEPMRPEPSGASTPLTITTPARLPEAIAGRRYELALSASGGIGPRRWAMVGQMPEGLEFDADRGLIRGVPEAGTPGPVSLDVRVSDGESSDSKPLELVVYRPDGPLSLPSPIEASLSIPRLPWLAWGELGFGFLVLLLLHMVAMNGVSAMERRSPAGGGWRFRAYRSVLRMSSVSAAVVLATWLWMGRPGGPGAERDRASATVVSDADTDGIETR